MKITTAIIALVALTVPALADQTTTSNSGSTSSAGSYAGITSYYDGNSDVTGYVGAMLNSSNNSPCGRTTFGVPSSGHNCTVREEARAIFQSLVNSVGPRRAARAATLHLCRNDRTMRETLIAAGECARK